MKLKNTLLVLALLAVAIGLLFFGLARREDKADIASSVNQNPTADETLFSENAAALAKEYFEENPADSYLVIRTEGYCSSPIPLNADNELQVTQPDGSKNVIHIGKNSFYMESSNCDNQNCVEEGEVTIENKDSRILFNMVYCLPHKLSLEMLTPEEAENMLCEMYAQQEAYTSQHKSELTEGTE